MQAVRARDLVRQGFRENGGQFLPTYFENGGMYNLGTSVYAQVVPVVLFGASVFGTRAVSAIAAVTACIAVSLTLKRVFRARFWWAAALLLAIGPAWFLHSRTAFETTIAVSFYAWFVHFYLLYRQEGRARWLAVAALFAALAFYSYSPMQGVVPATALLFVLSDAGFHWRRRRAFLLGLAVVAVLAIPYLRFRRAHPEATARHLQKLYSYWFDRSLSTGAKVARYAREYARGLSPRYWYRPNQPGDLDRHRMKGRGHLPLLSLPFAFLGIVLCLRNIRSPAHRALLLCALAAPAGASVASIGITRVLVFVVPASILTALGVTAVLEAVPRPSRTASAIACFGLLVFVQFAMVRDALDNGPTWFRDYGLGGMQYGARQVFGEVRRLRASQPDLVVRVSPDWANGTDSIASFFVDYDPKVELHDLDWYTTERRDLGAQSLAVLIPREYRLALDDRRLELGKARVMSNPDGTPGFYFVRLRYSRDADALMAEERRARHALVTEKTVMAGKEIVVSHSRLDMGPIGNVFDGNPASLIRTDRVNPAVVEIAFPEPRPIAAVVATTSSMDLELTVQLFEAGRSEPRMVSKKFERLPPDPTVLLRLEPRAERVERLRIEILNIRSPDIGRIHVRDLRIE